MDQEYVKNELVKFNLPEAAIAQLSKEYMPLKICGMDDRTGYKAVHEARMVIVRKRNEIEKKRKELKEDSIKYGKAVDTEAKRLTGLLQPIEDHLTKEQKAVDDEQKRIKEAAEKAEQERILQRTNLLFELGCRFNGINYSYGTFSVPQSIVVTVTDEDFKTLVKELQALLAAEAMVKAEAEAARKAEEKRLADVAKAQAEDRAKMDAETKRIAAERAALEAEKKAHADKIAAEYAEKLRAEQIKAAEERAAAQAKIDAEIQAKKDQEEKERIEAEIKAKEEKERALRPDKTKLLEFATLLETLVLPATSTSEGNDITGMIVAEIMKLSKKIRKAVKEL